MSKPKQFNKRKYLGWYTKEQTNYIFDLHKSLASEIQLYKLKDNIKLYQNVKPDVVHLNNTIDCFYSYSEIKIDKPVALKSVLESLYQHDLVMNFQGTNCLYHTYKILGFIREAVNALRLSSDMRFQKGTIGLYERYTQTHKAKYRKSRKLILDSENTSKGAELVKATLHKNMYLDEKLTKHYLGIIALFGVDSFKVMQNDTSDTRTLRRTLKMFMSGKVKKEDCANSLLAVLYFYFHFKMKIDSEKSIKVAKDIVYELFEIATEYRASELLKNLYVKEVIGENIVFGFSPKTKFITADQRARYKNKIIENQLIDTKKFPLFFIDESLNNPLRLYVLTTPSELLQEMA
jgi:hypothetical protein